MSGLARFSSVFLLAAKLVMGAATSNDDRNAPDLAARASGRLMISHASVVPKLVEDWEDGPVMIAFRLNRPAYVTLDIYDQWGERIRTMSLGNLEAGDRSVAWDGEDGEGRLRRGDWFTFTIQARDDLGNHILYDPTRQREGEHMQPRKFKVNRQTGEISYVLPKPALVRIRLGLRDGPLYRTLVNWQPQLAGARTLTWDSLDNSAVMNILGDTRTIGSISTFPLPPNSVLVAQSADVAPRPNPPPNRWHRTELPDARPSGRCIDLTHDPAACREPRFAVQMLKSEMSGDGVVRVSGIVPVRIEIDPRDRASLINRGFEVTFSVDGVFVFEEEHGTTPFTYHWDTRGLSPTRHFFTVNVLVRDDRVGAATVEVLIGE